MSDSITSCVVYKNVDRSVQYYDITFSFGEGTMPSPYNHVCIQSSALSNPNDLDEVKRLACQQASAIKALYKDAALITDLNGLVTL